MALSSPGHSCTRQISRAAILERSLERQNSVGLVVRLMDVIRTGYGDAVETCDPGPS